MRLFLPFVVTLVLAVCVSSFDDAKRRSYARKCKYWPLGKPGRGKICKPRSCLDHLKAGSTKSGTYAIYDANGNSFPVYCDMESEPGNAWTLVLSFQNKFRAFIEFRHTPLKKNAPVNEYQPNFKAYRQTLARMQSIKSHSKQWRSTCSFPSHKVDYRDYLRGNFIDFNIMTYIGVGQCKNVEYVNIRGHVGIQTKARFWQLENEFLHIDSNSGGCPFVPVVGSVLTEDNFGLYKSTNPNFRCTANADSSTNWWFGNHL